MGGSKARRVVWVVDDSRLDAERAFGVLARDYTVATFHDGSTALEKLSSGEGPDVMVLDWVMPGVSGLDVCRFLRAAGPASQRIGVLLLTVHRDTEQIVEGLSAGANDYLAKPYEDEELRARVASLVRTCELVDRLEAAQAENRKLLETAPDPLLVVDAHGCLTFVNEGAARVLATTREALLGRPLADFVPDLAERQAEPGPRESLLPLSDVMIGERRFSPTRRMLPDSDASSTIISLRDVTERRLLEERRLDFYSIIAHDLRTPLNAMTLRLSSMIGRSRKTPQVSLLDDLQKLDTRLGSLVSMINDFLDLASLEGAGYRMEHAEVDLASLIEQARDDFSPLLERSGHTFQGPALEHAADAIVYGDARRLNQVLSNLISNAIKFTPQAGTIKALLQVQPRYVEVAIEDTGTGVALEHRGKLFQRYARAEQRVGGTGLGLLIVREIVEAHGGTVGVESAPDGGSRFWFRLPRTRGVSLLSDAQ